MKHNSQSWIWFSLDSLLALWAALVCIAMFGPQGSALPLRDLLALPVSLGSVCWLGIFLVATTGLWHLQGLHGEVRQFQTATLMKKILTAAGLGALGFLFLPMLRNTLADRLLASLVFFALTACSAFLLRFLYRRLSTERSLRVRSTKTLIVGSGAMARSVCSSFVQTPSPVHILGCMDDVGRHTVPQPGLPVLGSLDELESFLMSTVVDQVMIALPLRSCYDLIQRVIHICERVGVPAAYAYQPFQHAIGYSRMDELGMSCIRWHPSRDVDRDAWKRTFDVVASAAGLVVLFPVMVGIAIAIRLTSPGPVIFVQERFGLNKRRFPMLKFRTMVANAEALQGQLEAKNEATGPQFKIRKDPRITAVGAFLRKTSLDELPQLLNVLRGEMSLVGPRPLPVRDVARFDDAALMRRFSVKPGLTCLWQVNGRSNTNFHEWITLDLKYIDTWSPLLDLKILARTIPAVVRGSGAM